MATISKNEFDSNRQTQEPKLTNRDDKWIEHFEALKAHVAVTGHFPDKHSTLNNWVRYQRKRIKAGLMTDEQKRLCIELADSRSTEHTGGRKKKDKA